MKLYKYIKYINILMVVAALIIAVWPTEYQVYNWLIKYDNFLMSYSWIYSLG